MLKIRKRVMIYLHQLTPSFFSPLNKTLKNFLNLQYGVTASLAIVV